MTNLDKDNATFNQSDTFITNKVYYHFQYTELATFFFACWKGQVSSTGQLDSVLYNKNKGKRKLSQSSERHLLFEKVDISTYKEDIGGKFQANQVAVAERIQEEELHIETQSHELLALSNIILIKPGQSSQLLNQYISTSTISKIEEKVQEKFNIKENLLNGTKKAKLEDIIRELRDKKISLKVATKKITAMTSNDDDVVELLFGVRNLIESIPASNFNYQWVG